MKKSLVIAAIVTITCFIFTGCFHEHTWREATCTEPKICTGCNEVEGVAKGHNFSIANYQEPSICLDCKIVDGEILTPDFVLNGLDKKFVEIGYEYEYITKCAEAKVKTKGNFSVTNYIKFLSDETHEAKEGYEWQVVEFKMVFSDDNAYKHGITASISTDDYYDIKGHDYSIETLSDDFSSFTANWKGTDYTECRKKLTQKWEGWKKSSNTLNCKAEFLVPTGYDGMVISVRDSANSWDDGEHIYDVADENTLFFRLK